MAGLSVRKYKIAVSPTARNRYSRNCPPPYVSANSKNAAASSSPNSMSARSVPRGHLRRMARSAS